MWCAGHDGGISSSPAETTSISIGEMIYQKMRHAFNDRLIQTPSDDVATAQQAAGERPALHRSARSLNDGGTPPFTDTSPPR